MIHLAEFPVIEEASYLWRLVYAFAGVTLPLLAVYVWQRVIKNGTLCRIPFLVKEYNDRLLFLLKLKSVVLITCLTVIIDKFVTVNSDAELCLAV